jgi:exodeoxyribonuclease VIII
VTARGETETYASIRGVNWSSLKYISVSPRMYRYRLANPEPRKKSYVIGGAIHCMVLEPETFADRYVVLDAATIREHAPPRSSKEGKALVAEHPEFATSAMTSEEYQAACVALAFPGREAISDKQYDTCVAASSAVMEHRVARDLLRAGIAEESVTWTDPDTGLLCKGRLDYLRPDLIIDLKSSRDPSPAKFERDTVNYGYASQVAFYHDGAMAAKRCTGASLPHIIAVRAKDDFDVACFRLTREAYETGRAIYRSLLQRLAECTAADYWPGVAPELRSLELPPWAVTQIIDNEPDGDF